MKTLSLTAGAVSLALLAGCAAQPPSELKTARSAYQQVAQSPAASVAPTDVYEAKKALQRAEVAFEDDGDSQETRDLAYIAERKAIIARARASTVASSAQKQAALAEIEQWKQNRALTTREELGETSKELAESQAELESERRARVAAEQRTAEALTALKGVSTKQEARGLVLTITGGVLFASGKSTLLPTAQKRLDEVITAVKTDPRQITVLGHTDSVGDEASNEALSMRRAESVRTYMTMHGVPENRIKAEGMGESQPIADNRSAEGRANNRRVEIILEGAAGGAPATPGMGQPSGGAQQGGASKGKVPGTTQPAATDMKSDTKSDMKSNAKPDMKSGTKPNAKPDTAEPTPPRPKTDMDTP
jgi:outer membrane protein OmpA-like peptidoglycan-associated protein